MNENELQELVELEKQSAMDREFGSPLNVFVGNVAEKTGGLLSSLGYSVNSPKISEWGETARTYGDQLKPQGRGYTPYENAAEYFGQVSPSMAISYATKSPIIGAAIDVTSEIGTIINELQRQGYSDEEIKAKLPYVIRDEGISGLLSGVTGQISKNPLVASTVKNRIPMRVNTRESKYIPKSVIRGMYGALSAMTDQPLQDVIYDKHTRR